ncbi:metalloregulator ArsR/SmtB family transcription factor [Paeniglutamicibacter sp. ZC-3]|uniref:ArsR/SmtB family transcription factor n=1 Tax=Paeniglutamicibacter sp. ZC-3 TaxID=2986919 RepID=UPI0021F7950F|nr:metalloregulator ArsR/SmtB family transcription factor [Paeniglutamicibacter sp. ZC-3]MCV9994399.1 metalloregulator ArsR/SmtB family transcription factor [Paeniglutamicibacter sp. ZC-3]
MSTPVAINAREETTLASASDTDTPCCVPAHGQGALATAEAEALAARFKALADPNRLRILSIVSSSPEAETCVCDLSEPLGLGQPTVSHHLKVMVEAGLLNREKRGVWAYYSLVPGALDSLAATLAPKA